MSATVNVLCLLNCVDRVERDLQHSEPAARPWVRIALESARREAGTAFEALRSAARRGDPTAQIALDALVASLAVNDAQSHAREPATLR